MDPFHVWKYNYHNNRNDAITKEKIKLMKGNIQHEIKTQILNLFAFRNDTKSTFISFVYFMEKMFKFFKHIKIKVTYK